MKAKIETITPAKAKVLLAQNPKNRTLSRSRVNQFSGAMKRGEWKLNGESIQIDTDGNLLNGQHRLQACIEANRSFKTLVCHDVDPSVMPTLDTGRPRSLSDALKINEFKNARLLGSSLQWAWKLLVGPAAIKGPLRPTHAQALKLLKDYEHLARSMSLLNRAEFRPVTSGMAHFVALHAVTYLQAPDQSDAFAEKLATGVGINTSYDPVKTLRDRLVRERASIRSSPGYFPVIWGIKAWNAFCKDQEIRTLRYSLGEKIPRIQNGPRWG